MTGLGDPTTARRSAAASKLVAGGAGDEEDVMGAEGLLLGGDCVLVGAPWGLVLAPKPLSSRMPEQEHGRRSPPETVPMAADEPQAPPQLSGDPATARSDAATTVAGGAGCDEEERVMEEAVVPLGDFIVLGAPWGLFLNPIPLSSAGHGAKRCVQCGAFETPRWRIRPMGLRALCYGCRIWLRPAEALREPVHVHLPPPAPATMEPAPEREEMKQKRKRKARNSQKSSS